VVRTQLDAALPHLYAGISASAKRDPGQAGNLCLVFLENISSQDSPDFWTMSRSRRTLHRTKIWRHLSVKLWLNENVFDQPSGEEAEHIKNISASRKTTLAT
jgi:hypothetical protein